MKKNSKNAFIFLDLLLATTMSVGIAVFIFSYITRCMFYYSLHKDNLAAYEIMSQMPLFFYQKKIPTSFKKGTKKFNITEQQEIIEHTPLHNVHTITLLHITISWENFYQQISNMDMKFLYES